MSNLDDYNEWLDDPESEEWSLIQVLAFKMLKESIVRNRIKEIKLDAQADIMLEVWFNEIQKAFIEVQKKTQ